MYESFILSSWLTMTCFHFSRTLPSFYSYASSLQHERCQQSSHDTMRLDSNHVQQHGTIDIQASEKWQYRLKIWARGSKYHLFSNKLFHFLEQDRVKRFWKHVICTLYKDQCWVWNNFMIGQRVTIAQSSVWCAMNEQNREWFGNQSCI